MLQSDVPEVCGAAPSETPSLQKHSPGATLGRTLEVSGRRHPRAAHRTKRRKRPLLFCILFFSRLFTFQAL